MATTIARYIKMSEFDSLNNKPKTTNKYPNTFRMSTTSSYLNNSNMLNNNNNNNDKLTSLKPLSNSISTYCLADIYEDAAVIGSELEKIISNYGSDVLKDLMPKVINVLELLENLTIKNEEENDELNELKVKVNYLEAEKYQKINEREKFEKVKNILKRSRHGEVLNIIFNTRTGFIFFLHLFFKNQWTPPLLEIARLNRFNNWKFYFLH